MPNVRSDEDLFNMALLGLSWVQDSNSARAGWTVNGVLQTLRQVGSISDAQYYSIARQPWDALRKYFIQRTVVKTPLEMRRPAAVLRDSERLLVAIQHTRLFVGELLLVPGGYRVLVTAAGSNQANRIAREYERSLAHDTFMGQWRQHRRQMSGMHGRQRAPRVEA